MAAGVPGIGRPGRQILRRGPGVIFPFYHTVSDVPLPHIKHLYRTRTAGQFEKDLDEILLCFQALDLNDLLKDPEAYYYLQRGNKALEGKSGRPSMVLSFDDGLIQCHEILLPILKRKGVPAVFFLNNAFLDNRDLFYRYKVSLLLDILPDRSAADKQKAAQLLDCVEGRLRKSLLELPYQKRKLCDQVAVAWDFSFSDYLEKHPVYLDSAQVRALQANGFRLGSHGWDHRPFNLLDREEGIRQIQSSLLDLRERFAVEERYFSFPHTDDGIPDEWIEALLREKILDAGFGTAGLKDDLWPAYFQRMPMEFGSFSARQVLRGEIRRRYLRLILGKNRVCR